MLVKNSYTTTDINPLSSSNFYRLKIASFNGGFTYSNIIKVNGDKPQLLQLLPNPAHDFVLLKGADGYNTVRIIDIAGKVQQQQTIKRSIEKINTANLAAGVYLLQLVGDAATTTLKLVKQ
jgi:hypothetical protein